MDKSYDLLRTLAIRVEKWENSKIHIFVKARSLTTCGVCFLPEEHPLHWPFEESDLKWLELEQS